MKKIILGIVIAYSLYGNSVLDKGNLEVSKIINNIEKKAISKSNMSFNNVKGKGSCAYWYYFVEGAYLELNNHSIHVKNGTFYKLQKITLKLHSKALSVCVSDKFHYRRLDGSSHCGGCISRYAIKNAHIRISNIEKTKEQEKINLNKRSSDANAFLETLK